VTSGTWECQCGETAEGPIETLLTLWRLHQIQFQKHRQPNPIFTPVE